MIRKKSGQKYFQCQLLFIDLLLLQIFLKTLCSLSTATATNVSNLHTPLRSDEFASITFVDPDDNFDPPELMDDDVADDCYDVGNNSNEFVAEEAEVKCQRKNYLLMKEAYM